MYVDLMKPVVDIYKKKKLKWKTKWNISDVYEFSMSRYMLLI